MAKPSVCSVFSRACVRPLQMTILGKVAKISEENYCLGVLINTVTAADARKYGTFLGVFVPSLLTILGVIMYLRMGWVVGHAGIISTVLILTIATSITFITGLSVSATATNMKVRSGGVYFMVSRCFGIESGAAIGIPLYLSQAIGITFYVAGFAETVHQYIPIASPLIITVVTLFLLLALNYYSTDIAMKSQVFILVIISLSLISLVFDKSLPELTSADLPSFTQLSFWPVFAVFFPAVTGITTGISMSGDLRNPTKSIPIGTIAAIITGSLVYLFIALLLWWKVPPEVLVQEPLILTSLSIAPWLIIAGVACSTLSSAIGSLMAGPRTLQAMAKDGIGPKILAKGFGPSNEPRVATLLTFLLALLFSMAGGIDVIAPILTMFFLTSYAALNLAAGLEGLTNNPSWRPSFSVHWSVSLAGSGLCLVAMLFINAQAAVVAVIFCIAVLFVMRRLRKHTRWDDIRRGLLMHTARLTIYRLSKTEETARTWRPHMLVLTGSPSSRWYLVEVANAISQGRGFLILASVVKDTVKREQVLRLESSMRTYLESKKIEGLVKIKPARNDVEGIEHLVADYGLGALAPNTVVLGVSEESLKDQERITKLADILYAVHRAQKNAVLVRQSQLQGAQENEGKWQHGDIDIWWGRKKKNATLMLILGYMIQTSADWMGARLNLKTLVETKEQNEAISKYLREFVKQSRLAANIDVQRVEERSLYSEKIKQFSAQAGLIILGIRPPEEDEPHAAYSQYILDLLVRTTGYPKTLFVLSGEDISFEDVLV